jgi:N-acetyl-gamma-glutamyl-phosphate reductase
MQSQGGSSSARKVAVLGASGYSGAEALRLLAGHPSFEVAVAAAGDSAGSPIASVYPSLTPAYGDAAFASVAEASALGASDVEAALIALPHGESSRIAPGLVERGVRVVDLAGDFRLPAEEYPRWYGFEHTAPEWLGKAVYGLPELFGGQVAGAELVANPGCYPTAAALAIGPLLEAGLADPSFVAIDAKSGVSGAGRKPSDAVHYGRTAGSVRPYKVGSHQHTPEIELVLGRLAGAEVSVTFVPHLIPAVRGVLATCYAKTSAALEDLHLALTAAYEGKPFVRVVPPGEMPDPKRVTASNVCEVGVGVDARRGVLVAVGAVDNLVKGAAGQAIQNLNLMLGEPETAGLPVLGVFP